MELYGGEGVGKTELLLHLTSSAILIPTSQHGNQTPTSPGQQHFHGNQTPFNPGQQHHFGNQTQVVWVDCDLKFSVLRLAVLLEQRIVNCELSSNSSGKGKDESQVVGEDCQVNDEHVSKSGKGREVRTVGAGQGDFGPAEADSNASSTVSSVCDIQRTTRSHVGASHCHTAAAAVVSCSQRPKATGSGLKRKATETEDRGTCLELQEQSNRLPRHSNSKASDGGCDKLESGDTLSAHEPHSGGVLANTQSEGFQRPSSETQSKAIEGFSMLKEGDSGQMQTLPVQDNGANEPANELSAEKVERRVAECLERVLVVRCASSQQLICTLHSLESVIAANRNIAVLVVDPVSAFFWSDKCRDYHSSSFVHKNMSHVASILKKIANSYGVLVVTTKQALIKPRPKDRTDNVVFPCEELGTGAGADKHVEFLGKAWSEAVTQRFVCSRSVQCQEGLRMTGYTLSGAAGTRRFTISESGVCFDQ